MLLDIVTGEVPPASQALVFIPKADFGEKADNFRPLDMPNTIDRLLDSVVYAVASQARADSLYPAQSLSPQCFSQIQVSKSQIARAVPLRFSDNQVPKSQIAQGVPLRFLR